ncbi:hypothetical protein, partial [Citrobacter sedlakii]|uniref:hypothetical protein n=1 Tax=Citrobacter sedlakii TaxID=67826 RepID=UPI003B4369D7
ISVLFLEKKPNTNFSAKQRYYTKPFIAVIEWKIPGFFIIHKIYRLLSTHIFQKIIFIAAIVVRK